MLHLCCCGGCRGGLLCSSARCSGCCFSSPLRRPLPLNPTLPLNPALSRSSCSLCLARVLYLLLRWFSCARDIRVNATSPHARAARVTGGRDQSPAPLLLSLSRSLSSHAYTHTRAHLQTHIDTHNMASSTSAEPEMAAAAAASSPSSSSSAVSGAPSITLTAHASTEKVSRESSDEVDLAGEEHTDPALLEAVRSRVSLPLPLPPREGARASKRARACLRAGLR